MSRIEIQRYTLDDGTIVRFRDEKQNLHSGKCQPRDITLIDGSYAAATEHDIRHAICLDVRRGQGYPEVGLAKNMLWG